VDFRHSGTSEQAPIRASSDTATLPSQPSGFPQHMDLRFSAASHPHGAQAQNVRTWGAGGVALPPAPASSFHHFSQPGWPATAPANQGIYQSVSAPGVNQQPAASAGNIYSGVQLLEYAAGTPRIPRQMSNSSQGTGMSLRIPSNLGSAMPGSRMVATTPLAGSGDLSASGPRVDRISSFDSAPAMLAVNSPHAMHTSDHALPGHTVGGSSILTLPGLPGVEVDTSLPIRLCNAVQGQTHAEAKLVPQETPSPPEESSSGAAPKGPPPAAALLTNTVLCGLTEDGSLPMAAKLPQLAAKLDQAVAARDGHSLAAMATGRGVTLPLRLCSSHSSQLSKLNNELVRQAYTGDSSTASPELQAILAHVWDGVHLTLVGFVATVIAIRMGASEVAVPPSLTVFDFASLHISATGHSAQYLNHKQRGSKLVGLNRLPLQTVLSKCSQLAFIASSLSPQVASAMEAFFQNVVDGNSSVGLTTEVFSAYRLHLSKLNAPAVLDLPTTAIATQSMVMTPMWRQLMGIERSTAAELARIAARSASGAAASASDLLTHHDVSTSGLLLARLHAMCTGSRATSSVVIMLRQRVDASHSASLSPMAGAGAPASAWTYQPFLAVESRFDEYIANGELLCSVRYVSDIVQSSRHLTKSQATGQGQLLQHAVSALLVQEPMPRLVKQLSWMRHSTPALVLWRVLDLSLRRLLMRMLVDTAAVPDSSLHSNGGGGSAANTTRRLVIDALGVSGIRQLASILQQEQRKPLMLFDDAAFVG